MSFYIFFLEIKDMQVVKKILELSGMRVGMVEKKLIYEEKEDLDAYPRWERTKVRKKRWGRGRERDVDLENILELSGMRAKMVEKKQFF